MSTSAPVLSPAALAAPGPPRRGVTRSRRALWWRGRARKAVAALLVGLAAWFAVAALRGGEAPATVVVARGELPAGHVVAAADLDVRGVDPRLLPAAAVTDPASAIGQVVGAPVGAGEILTSARLHPARAYADLGPDRRAVHVPVADPGGLGLVRAGDHVDLVTLDTGTVVGTDLLVLAVDAPGATGGLGGGATPARGLVVAAPVGALKGLVPAAGRAHGDGVHVVLRPQG